MLSWYPSMLSIAPRPSQIETGFDPITQAQMNGIQTAAETFLRALASLAKSQQLNTPMTSVATEGGIWSG